MPVQKSLSQKIKRKLVYVFLKNNLFETSLLGYCQPFLSLNTQSAWHLKNIKF